MTKLRVLTYLLMTALPLLFNQCRPTESELTPTDKSKHSGAKEASSCNAAESTPTSATVGNYAVTFISSATTTTGSVWKYQVEKVGNGGGPLYFSMGCVTAGDYAYVKIGNEDIQGSEEGFTHGKDCQEADGSFLKIAALNSAFNGGPPDSRPTSVTIEIGLTVQVDPAAGTVSSIAVGQCELKSMITPGCYHVCGTIQQAECAGDPIPLASATVTLTNATNSYTATTDPDGTYCFCPVMPGSYTLTVAGQTTTVTVGPGSIDAFVFTVPAICTGCSFSQGFYFSSPVGIAYSASQYNLTVGGKSYSQSEAIAIFKGRAGGSANLSNIFTQCATIKLSVALGSTTLSGPVATYVNTLDTYLSGMLKLNGSSLLTNSKLPKMSGGILTTDAVAAANNISLWIYNNHCTEVVP